jgi:hypothetical protein
MIASFHDKHGTPRKLDVPVGAPSNHPLIERSMACRPDHQQVGAEISRKLRDVTDVLPSRPSEAVIG